MKIAHIINPLIAKETSDLFHAQPMTFKSMIEAKQYALKKNPYNTIELLATVYEEDMRIIPKEFRRASNLQSSILDIMKPKKPRKLPFVKDVIDKALERNPEYLIYTNVDIALMPDFYTKIIDYIKLGHDGIIINRTTMPSYNNKDLDWFVENIQIGKRHPGYDCFVIKKELYDQFQLGQIVVGINWIGEMIKRNILYLAKNPILLWDSRMTFHMGDDSPVHVSTEYQDQQQFNAHQAQILTTKLESLIK